MKPYYSLSEVAAGTRLDTHFKHPELWLADQIRKHRVRATKLGRSWFMNTDQIDAMLTDLENHAPTPREVEVGIHRGGLSVASARRRAS